VSVLARKRRRDLHRRRFQYSAVVLTVFLGVALFGASYDAFRNLDASYNRAYEELRFANLTITDGDVDSLERRVESTPGVEAVEARVQADLPIQVGETKLLGRVIGLPAGRQPEVNRVDVKAGTYLESASTDGVLVEQHMADHFELDPGDRVRVHGAGGRREVEVLGVAASPEYLWPARSRQDLLPSPDDFGVVFATEALALELAGVADPNQLVAYYDGGRPNQALTGQLTAASNQAGAGVVLTRAEQPSNSALQEDIQGFQELAIMFPVLFLSAAALATGVLLRRLVIAERPIVGMLRACGFSRAHVIRHYLGFGLLVGLVGGVLGAAVGFLLAGAVTNLYTSALSIPVTVTQLSLGTVIVGIVFGLATGILAAALPARAAAATPPAEAMRRFAPARGGRSSLAERAVPPLRRLPPRWAMVMRGVGRNRARTASTALGVVLALVLILVSWGMIDTVQILVDRQFTEVDRQDAQLYFAEPLDRAVVREVSGTEGVERAEPAVQVPVSLRRGTHSYATTLVGLEPDTQMHGFLSAGGGETELPSGGLLAGEALSSELDAGVGQEIRITSATEGADAGLSTRAPVREFLDEPLGTMVYASLPAIRAVAGPAIGIGNVALVRYEPGADREAMRDRLSRLPGVVAFEDTRALLETVNQYLGLFYAFVGVMLVFGGAMAFALMFNSISSSIAERSVELATMKASGAGFGTLARLITAENVLITILGIGPGLVIGYIVAAVFMDSFSSDQFSFALQMRGSTLVLSALAILGVALLSQWPGLRAVRRIDVARVVRERAA